MTRVGGSRDQLWLANALVGILLLRPSSEEASVSVLVIPLGQVQMVLPIILRDQTGARYLLSRKDRSCEELWAEEL